MKKTKADTAPKKRGRPKKEKPPETKKMGRPSKLNQQSTLDKAKKLYLKGCTDIEVAEILGVSEQTINNWKKRDKNFVESLKDWKDEADKEVEKSLYQRACGYDRDDHHYPADPTSMIFWLKNRKRLEWRDKTDIEHTGNVIINAPTLDKDE